jgi:adenine-specific DNA-methyltransferase
VTAADLADYSAVLAECFVATDASRIDPAELSDIVGRLNHAPDVDGYVTDTFCRRARFFQEFNGRRIDAIRRGIEEYRDTDWFPILLTSLLLAADRVDSTTGVQMAYLKQWAPRSYRPLELVSPALLRGPGRAHHGDASDIAAQCDPVDFAYVDPPYNQHRYESNYHIWNTLVRGDEPAHYGVACKRVDLRDRTHRSPFNARRTFGPALAHLLSTVRARTVVVSYNDESWVSSAQIGGFLRDAGHECVGLISFDSARYVGARIGIHGSDGSKVGTVGRLRNREWLVLAGDDRTVECLLAVGRQHGGEARLMLRASDDESDELVTHHASE